MTAKLLEIMNKKLKVVMSITFINQKTFIVSKCNY